MNTKEEKEGIILIPYAQIPGASSGVNIRDERRETTYYKNACVACLSAKRQNPDYDVALVSNVDVPEPYAALLQKGGVMLVKQEFDLFRFPNDYKWCLAFYKLCALYHAAREMPYRCYAYLDTDVYIHAGFAAVFEESRSHLLLYDINEGLQVESYRNFLEQVRDWYGQKKLITRYGGEFFAANREQALMFSDACLRIFHEMHTRRFETTFGDEFILSLAAEESGVAVRNAGAYVFRFWTGEFRLVSTCYRYNPVAVFHVPDEKNGGMLALYDRYIARGKTPGDAALYRILHLRHRSLNISVRMLVKKIIRYRK